MKLPQHFIIRAGRLRLINGKSTVAHLKLWQKKNKIPDGTIVNIAVNKDLQAVASELEFLRSLTLSA